jgi:hypothetical protein
MMTSQRPLAATLNHLLSRQPQLREILLPHAGKSARMAVGTLQIELAVANDGLVQAANQAEPHVTIRIKPADLPQILANMDRAFSYVSLSGDAEFAKAVEAMEPGDFAQVVSLSDGSVMVLQVTETVPPTPVPFEKAREKITAAYQAEALAKALTALAESHLAAAKSGTRLETLGITDNVASATRSTKLPAVPADVLAAAFTLKPEDVVKVDANGIVALVRLDAIKPADLASEGSKADMDALSQQTAQSIAQDAYELFSTAMTTQGGLTIDQAAITAVQARMN